MFRALLRGATVVGAVSFLTMAGGPAQATTFTSFAGDVDCFGVGGSCPDGSDFPGPLFTSLATASDPPFTDDWEDWGAVSYGLDYAGPAAASASVEIRVAGIANTDPAVTRGPYDVFFNGTDIGQITQDLSGGEGVMVRTIDWAVPVALLQAHNTFSFTGVATGDNADAWTLDYVRLTADTAVGAPEPEGWALMVAGFAALGAAVRQRRRATA